LQASSNAADVAAIAGDAVVGATSLAGIVSDAGPFGLDTVVDLAVRLRLSKMVSSCGHNCRHWSSPPKRTASFNDGFA
jgi:hypothetical protein